MSKHTDGGSFRKFKGRDVPPYLNVMVSYFICSVVTLALCSGRLSPLNLTGYHLRDRLAAKDNPGGLDQGRTLLKAIVTAVNFFRHSPHIAGLSEGVAPVCFPEPASGTGCDGFPQQ